MAYLPLIVFVLAFSAVVAGETVWLRRKTVATALRSWAFAMLTDTVGLISSGVVVGGCILLAFMMIMGPSGTGGSSPDWAYILVGLIALVVPLVVMVLLKRLGLLIFSLMTGRPAWNYALISSVIFSFLVYVPAALTAWLLTKLT